MLTAKWMLAQKLRIPKIKFTDYMKLKKKDKKCGCFSPSWKGEPKPHRRRYGWQNMEQRLKKRPSRQCPTWGSFPSRHYC